MHPLSPNRKNSKPLALENMVQFAMHMSILELQSSFLINTAHHVFLFLTDAENLVLFNMISPKFS